MAGGKKERSGDSVVRVELASLKQESRRQTEETETIASKDGDRKGALFIKRGSG